jgi:succinylarginine dihydrolase
MRNGGGPACLRLRVPLMPAELAAVNPRALFSAERHAELVAWADRRYREELRPTDLADPKLLDESRTALDELTAILGLGSIYDFQRA